MGKFLLVTSFYNNTKEHVQTTFDNVLKQSHQDWMLVVGDDFSDDPEFRTYLKNEVIKINDPRIIYYNVQYKRELYLYQNFFQEYEYDYYFDLDSDDILDSNILEIYNKHFDIYPNVNSIFSDFNKVDEDNNLKMLSLVQPPSNYLDEFQFRDTQDFSTVYSKRSGQHMFGVARAMRNPKIDQLPIKELCKTATDSLFLFFNLTKGDHLHIPRKLYTYIDRPNSDSSFMPPEEYSKFNLNVRPYLEQYTPSTFKSPYASLWFETSAISSCEWLKNVSEFCLITNPGIDLDLLQTLYPDKKIVLNDFTHKNQIVVWNTLSQEIKAQLQLNSVNNCTVFFSDENYKPSPTEVISKIDNSTNEFRKELDQYLAGYSWYNYFRQCIVTKVSLPKLLIIQPHLSTGGCPQYLLDFLEEFKNNYSDIKVIEASNLSREFVIQKNKLISALRKDQIITLGEFECSDEQWLKDKLQIIPIIHDYSPDIIWFNECPEGFEYRQIPNEVLDKIYTSNRSYKIVETTHYNAFDFSQKQYIPDEFMFCSQKHLKDSEHIDIPKTVWEVPIKKKTKPNREQTLINLGLDPNKFHVLNVGLFNNNKNQKYIFNIAEQTKNLPIQYHFIGNTCFLNECEISDYQLNLPNCKVWGERSDVDVFMSCMDLYFFPSKKELNPLTIKEALSWDMLVLANYEPNYSDQYKDYSNFYLIQTTPFKDLVEKNFNLSLPTVDSQNEITINFFKKPKVEINGIDSLKYLVKFINNKTNEIIWEDTISNNMWTCANPEYYVEWRVEVWNNGKLICNETVDYQGKKVFITLDSKSIGDTIAWFPYIDNFQKLHKCKVTVSTFHNDWFQSQYPNLDFVPPGSYVDGLYDMFDIGWFYNEAKNPTPINTIPLQQTASDILGLPFKEIKPKLKNLSLTPIKEKYVTISIQSTGQAKYWNHPTGWSEVVNYLQSKGYKVAVVDKDRSFGIPNFTNTSPECDYHFHNKSLDEVMSVINGADLHIGIGSGLSWLAWALNTPTVLISSFSKPWCEFQSNCIRIYGNSPTSGYFNTHRLDPSDWNWYPFKKINSMEDWYEIETITPEQVIDGIKKFKPINNP